MALIPALDAEGSVGTVVAGAKDHVAQVVVVDDGSTDATAAEAASAGAHVISHGKNLGKGAALRTGFAYAVSGGPDSGQDPGFDAVVTLDADGQHDPADIPRLVAAAGPGAGLVIGSRLWDKGSIPKKRYRANMVGVWCISGRAGCPVEDSQSGFRLYSARLIRDIKFNADGFEAETELIIRAGRRGYGIVSVPVRAVYSEQSLSRSHYRTVRDTYRICILYLKSFFWRR